MEGDECHHQVQTSRSRYVCKLYWRQMLHLLLLPNQSIERLTLREVYANRHTATNDGKRWKKMIEIPKVLSLDMSDYKNPQPSMKCTPKVLCLTFGVQFKMVQAGIYY